MRGPGPGLTAGAVSVGVGAQDRCEEGGVYSVTALGGVQVAPSPAWLQQRLERAGLRAINNVVDITNLVMLELGQPLHAFDSARLQALGGGRLDPAMLDLRPARSGEAFTALDGSEHSLSEEAFVVSYADHAVALAGVMGG